MVGNLLTGQGWNQGIPTFGGVAPKNQMFDNPNIISPVPTQDQLTQGLIYKMKNDQRLQDQAKIPSSFTPKTVQYPDWMANAPKVDYVPTTKNNYNQIAKAQQTQSAIQQVQKIKNTVPSPVQALPNPTTQPQQFNFKYANEVQQASNSSGLPQEAFHLLRAGENKAENPNAIYKNNNGTWDVGLYQINVDPRNTAEVERLKNPLYNTMRAAEIFKSRVNLLKDPVLAIASYNLGAGGAVLNPAAAIKRAQWVYYNAGLTMPQTEFTKDPLGYVRKNMDYYRQLGLFK